MNNYIDKFIVFKHLQAWIQKSETGMDDKLFSEKNKKNIPIIADNIIGMIWQRY